MGTTTTNPGPKPGQIKRLNLMVDATKQCQLNCRYCYYGKKCGDIMNPENLAIAVQNVAGAMNGSLREIDLHYMGGEPLLAWDQIQILNSLTRIWCNEHHVKFAGWGMTSNLVALDEAKTKTMIEEKAGIHCSIDGPARIHDKNRPRCGGQGSFEQVVRNIPLALQISPRDVARVTVMPENAGDLVEITETLLGFGFKTVGLFPAYEPEWTDDAVRTWALSLVQAYEASKLNGTPRIRSIVRSTQKKTAGFSYCGAGKGLWALDTDGRLYHCHHFTNSPEYAVVDAVNTAPEEILARMAASTLVPFGKPIPATCLTCPAREHCNGMCWANNFLANGDSTLPVSNECRLFIASHELLWPIMEPDQQKEKMHACARCESCESCYSCNYCDSCQSSCETGCQICVSGCQSSCERSCQNRCEDRCQSSCESSCQDCQSGCEIRHEGGCCDDYQWGEPCRGCQPCHVSDF